MMSRVLCLLFGALMVLGTGCPKQAAEGSQRISSAPQWTQMTSGKATWTLPGMGEQKGIYGVDSGESADESLVRQESCQGARAQVASWFKTQVDNLFERSQSQMTSGGDGGNSNTYKGLKAGLQAWTEKQLNGVGCVSFWADPDSNKAYSLAYLNPEDLTDLASQMKQSMNNLNAAEEAMIEQLHTDIMDKMDARRSE